MRINSRGPLCGWALALCPEPPGVGRRARLRDPVHEKRLGGIPSILLGLKAERENVETADAVRLQIELAKATCESCGQKPKVYCTRGETRYIRCACGRTGQVTVERTIIRYRKMLTDDEFAAVMEASEEPPAGQEPPGGTASGLRES